MDKSRVCMSRTINLAKQKCQKNTSLLIYEKSGSEATKPHAVPPIYQSSAKKIRICTGAELKKICRPPPCPCPPKKKSLGFLGVVMELFGFGLKSAFVASLIYWTWEAGIWGDSDSTEEFYVTICNMMAESEEKRKILSEACEAELDLMAVPPPPQDKCRDPPINNERSLYKLKEAWNYGVTTIFEGIVGFPGNVTGWYNKKEEEECSVKKK